MSLAGLSLRDLEYVLAVAEFGHFGRAADHCGVSQPALSAQIRRLEETLGVVIFERNHRRVLVTKSGDRIIAHARQVIAEARALLEAAQSIDGALHGDFRLGAISTVGPYLLPYALKSIRSAFPAIHLILNEGRTSELLEKLQNGSLDALVACAPLNERGLVVHELFFEPFVLAHSPQCPALWPLPETGEELVLLEEGHCLRDQTLMACGPVAPRAKRHATGLEMLRHMVAAGEGVSLMPALAAKALGGLDDLVVYTALPDDQAGRQVVLAVRHADPRCEHLARLADVIRESVPPPARITRQKDA